MRIPGFERSSRGTVWALLLLSPLTASIQGCTDLEETPLSSITPDNFYRNEQEVMGGLAAVYSTLYGTLWAYYNLSEISTDEMVVPTRGSDWYDNGRWLEIHNQGWSATSPATLEDVNGVWNTAFGGIARANALLEALPNVSVANKPVVEAEARTLRAFYYFMLMDMFGGVPVVTDTEIAERERASRAEVFQFIESELQAARESLPASWPAMHGRLTKGAADAILASIYLNAEVFTGTVTEAGLQRGAPRWEDAIAAADRILNAGEYSLAADWHANFRHDNHLSPENIFVVKHRPEAGVGFQMIYRPMHYNHGFGGGWNGFSTLAETYYAFDQEDARENIFLVGCQTNLETGEPIQDRSGQPLCITPEIRDVTDATESEGARIYKWPGDPNRSGVNHGNDYAYFRLGEIYLIKAEALNELGRTGEAVALVNTLRARVFDPDEPLTGTFTQASFRDRILQERLFELTGEAKRRQDLVRHGAFTDAWSFKTQKEPYRILMPIPQTQIDANPMLTQNPGY
jgi:hypothetical protein